MRFMYTPKVQEAMPNKSVTQLEISMLQKIILQTIEMKNFNFMIS